MAQVGNSGNFQARRQGRTSWKTLVWRNLNIGVAKWNIGVARLSIRYNFNFRLPIGFCTLGRQTWHKMLLFYHSWQKFRKSLQKVAIFLKHHNQFWNLNRFLCQSEKSWIWHLGKYWCGETQFRHTSNDIGVATATPHVRPCPQFDPWKKCYANFPVDKVN